MARKQYEKGETVLVYSIATDSMVQVVYVQRFVGEDGSVAHELNWPGSHRRTFIVRDGDHDMKRPDKPVFPARGLRQEWRPV